ncbi:hypothetical protein LIER_15871 [Lithospermum erythrorhizon]|uniref:Mitochondrial protein n=1 Tax=Lithospermum erythrorhizon TaxID=34254 RepID=A0AAV3Q5G5_LITER
MKDLGILKYFLGVEVAPRSQEGIFFSQRKYAIDIISETGLLGAKPFLHEPRLDHWTTSLRVVEYLKGCPGQGILLKAHSSLQLSGWFDSDWASCPITRRSVSRWIVFLGDSLVSWKTKKIQHSGSIELLCDSQSAMHLAQNPFFH